MKKHKLALVGLGVIALSLNFGSLAVAAEGKLLAVASKKAELSTFVKMVQQAGLTEALETGELTVFAPTNDAFKAVPAATMDELSRDPEKLKSVLTYHVVPTKVKASSIDGVAAIATVNGAKLNVSRAGDFIAVDDGMVVEADIVADNGLIHEIDRVLVPAVKK